MLVHEMGGAVSIMSLHRINDRFVLLASGTNRFMVEFSLDDLHHTLKMLDQV